VPRGTVLLLTGQRLGRDEADAAMSQRETWGYKWGYMRNALMIVQ
jgi:hypothetical protein